MQFVHLHCHSHYSFYSGTASPEKLVCRASELRMPALALTDLCNLHGVPEFCRSAAQFGIKPILGMEAIVVSSGQAYGLTLLAMNEEGWRNLIQLSTLAFCQRKRKLPAIYKELLCKHNAGLVCLSGFAGGEVGSILIKYPNWAKAVAQWYQDTFGDRFYLELRNHGIKSQETLVEQTVDIGRALGIETVATNDIHYLDQEDWKLHDMLLCIKYGKMVSDEDRPKMGSEQHYFRSAEEMVAAFSEQLGAVHRTVEIAERIEPDIFSTCYSKKHHPVFRLQPFKSADELLRELCFNGLVVRYADSPLADKAKQRLETELTVIQKMGQANYFLIVGDIARFAESQGIYHTARGSAVGSMICYVLGISHECPLEFGLLFERFLDEQQPTLPDIDMDFDEERRGEIIDYVMGKYGDVNIVRIGTISTFGLRGAIKEIGKTLDMPIPFVDDVLKLFPMLPEKTVERALAENTELNSRYENEPQVKELLDFATKIHPCHKKAGVHACGFAIANVPLQNFAPLQKNNHDNATVPLLNFESLLTNDHNVATQWQGGEIESAGVLRLDFLGLRALTKIAKTIETIKETKVETIDSYKIPLNDRKTFDLISQGETKDVFQLESEGMRELLQRLMPDNFRDIVAVMALYRPGPLSNGMLDHYVMVKHGKKTPEYLHPVMEEVLSETYGIMVYQEQVMQIQNRLGNIPLGDGYACIKAICKKIDFSKFREEFVAGSKANGLTEKKADDIFELIVQFAPYSFLKSHAVGYARLAYITAYLKAHYPEEFAVACSEH